MGATSTLVLDVETVGATTSDQAEAVAEMAEARGVEPAAFAALCPPLARVVCIGFLDIETGRECVITALHAPDEKDLLQRANAIIAKAARLVTFNGRGFDLPVLMHRSVIVGATPSPTLVRAAREYRFKPNLHVDLREQFTFFGAAPTGSLRAFCLGYGLADPKADGDGSDVARLVEAGDAERLGAYCLGDVKRTAELYKRWRDTVGVAA